MMLRYRRVLLVSGCALAIVTICASCGLPESIQRTREAVLKTELSRMREAISYYQRDTHRYPPSLLELANAGYIRQVPEDPFTKSTQTWRTISADGISPPAIRDVKSGAEGRGLDGTLLADW